jgi:5-methylcytosine-specific restriction protein A
MTLLQGLLGKTLLTLSGQPNTVLQIRDSEVFVGTRRSPRGEWVPTDHVQRGLDELATGGEVEITPEKFGYRSAFVGAVLRTLPGVIALKNPARVLLAPALGPLMTEAFSTVPLPRPDTFSGDDPFAQLFEKRLQGVVAGMIPAGSNYLVRGSVGKGRWAETPWVAVFDPMVTVSALRGFYVVYLFRKDGSGAYLSLNQGTTAVRDEAKGQYLQVLRDRARTYMGLLPPTRLAGLLAGPIDLGGGRPPLTPGYEAGNIVARLYSPTDIPGQEAFASDLARMLDLYALLVSAKDAVEDEGELDEGEPPSSQKEARRLRWHLRAEGRNSQAAKKAKRLHGYRCQVCDFDYVAKYGELGSQYVEAHHLVPFSGLDERPKDLDPKKDFAVLCANCHRMVHRKTLLARDHSARSASYVETGSPPTRTSFPFSDFTALR